MKFINALTTKWHEFYGQADERVEAESNRVYKKAFIGFTIFDLVVAYYLMNLGQIAYIHDVDTAAYDAMSNIAPALCIGVLAICVWVSSTLGKKGIYSGGRASMAEEFPVKFHAQLAFIAAALFFLGQFLVRVFAEIQVAGIMNVFWAQNAGLALILAVIVGVGSFIGFKVSFDAAKKRQAELLAQLDADEE